MKREEILEASRIENNKKDYYELEVNLKASRYGSIAIIIFAIVFYFYEKYVGKTYNPAFYSIIALFNCVVYGYRAIKLKEKRILYIIASLLWGLLVAILLAQYFIQ